MAIYSPEEWNPLLIITQILTNQVARARAIYA